MKFPLAETLMALGGVGLDMIGNKWARDDWYGKTRKLEEERMANAKEYDVWRMQQMEDQQRRAREAVEANEEKRRQAKSARKAEKNAKYGSMSQRIADRRKATENKRFQDQKSKLDTFLLQRGFDVGSPQYNNAMRDIMSENSKNLGNIDDEAFLLAEQLKGSKQDRRNAKEALRNQEREYMYKTHGGLQADMLGGSGYNSVPIQTPFPESQSSFSKLISPFLMYQAQRAAMEDDGNNQKFKGNSYMKNPMLNIGGFNPYAKRKDYLW